MQAHSFSSACVGRSQASPCIPRRHRGTGMSLSLFLSFFLSFLLSTPSLLLSLSPPLWNPVNYNLFGNPFIEYFIDYTCLTTLYPFFCSSSLWLPFFFSFRNSVDTGPHMDLVGALAPAVRKRNITFGCYHRFAHIYNNSPFLSHVSHALELHSFSVTIS